MDAAVDQGGGDLPVKLCGLGAGAVVRAPVVTEIPRCNRQPCRRNKSQEDLHGFVVTKARARGKYATNEAQYATRALLSRPHFRQIGLVRRRRLFRAVRHIGRK